MKEPFSYLLFRALMAGLTFFSELALGGDEVELSKPEHIHYAVKTTAGETITMDTTANIPLGPLMKNLNHETIRQLKQLVADSGHSLTIYLTEKESFPTEVKEVLHKAQIPYKLVPISTPVINRIRKARSSWVESRKSQWKYLMEAKPSPADWFLGYPWAPIRELLD